MNHSHKPGEECPICAGGSMDEFLANTRRLVRQYGHSVLAVSDIPPFSYTIGLTEAGLPELIIFGLHPSQAQPILNDLAKQMRQRERGFDDGELIRLGGPSGGAAVPVKAIATTLGADHCNIARNLYGDAVQVMQILVPDTRGRFPPKCDKPYNQQPVLR